MENELIRPSNEIIDFVIANTGGANSPYILTKGPTYRNAPILPPAPSGTTRTTTMINGVAYFPLTAPCPAVSCTNSDSIAHVYASSDGPTKAYLEAVNRDFEKTINVIALGASGFNAIVGAGKAVTGLYAAINDVKISGFLDESINSVYRTGANTLYPEGLNFNSKIPGHLNGPDGFSQKAGISGTHNPYRYTHLFPLSVISARSRQFHDIFA